MVKEKEKPGRKMWLEFPPWEHVIIKIKQRSTSRL
jgi:hypothetical protein